MILYIKQGCPWCAEALEWLQIHGYHSLKVINILENKEAYDRMIAISGQRKTPTLELKNKQVLADFDTGQLERFLNQNGVQP